MADFLAENPEAAIAVDPQQYELKEKEYMLFYEAKKRYVMARNGKNTQSFNEKDSIQAEKMSIKDSLFINYLNNKVQDSMLFTVQDKCLKLIGTAVIDGKFKKLNKERLKVFLNYFKEHGNPKHLQIMVGKNVVPYNGFSFYKITYKGNFPEHLLTAYGKMNKLNNETPRKKFKKERKKIGVFGKTR